LVEPKQRDPVDNVRDVFDLRRGGEGTRGNTHIGKIQDEDD